jgi:hypothetical protein
MVTFPLCKVLVLASFLTVASGKRHDVGIWKHGCEEIGPRLSIAFFLLCVSFYIMRRALRREQPVPPEEKPKIDVVLHYQGSRLMQFWPSAFQMQTDFMKVLGGNLAVSLGLVEHADQVDGVTDDDSEYSRAKWLARMGSTPAATLYIVASLCALVDLTTIMPVDLDLAFNWLLTIFFLIEFAIHGYGFGSKWSYGSVFIRQQISVLVEAGNVVGMMVDSAAVGETGNFSDYHVPLLYLRGLRFVIVLFFSNKVRV